MKIYHCDGNSSRYRKFITAKRKHRNGPKNVNSGNVKTSTSTSILDAPTLDAGETWRVSNLTLSQNITDNRRSRAKQENAEGLDINRLNTELLELLQEPDITSEYCKNITACNNLLDGVSVEDKQQVTGSYACNQQVVNRTHLPSNISFVGKNQKAIPNNGRESNKPI